jgi:hypothetical protein
MCAITVVFDNNPFDPRLRTSWGFAAWLEYGDRTVLFDTGGDGSLLLRNMAVLDLDPQTVDIVVLSHIHGDHTGGLGGLLAVNPAVAVYVPQVFPARFKDQVRSSGATALEVSGPIEILPGLWSTGQMGTGLIEQALVARTEKGLVIVTGCAHPGVDRMVARAKKVAQDEIALVGSDGSGRVKAQSRGPPARTPGPRSHGGHHTKVICLFLISLLSICTLRLPPSCWLSTGDYWPQPGNCLFRGGFPSGHDLRRAGEPTQ